MQYSLLIAMDTGWYYVSYSIVRKNKKCSELKIEKNDIHVLQLNFQVQLHVDFRVHSHSSCYYLKWNNVHIYVILYGYYLFFVEYSGFSHLVCRKELLLEIFSA
jgi:hypothetical protein